MNNESNIGGIKSDCYSCGACTIVCPCDSIDFCFSEKDGCYRISLDNDRCINCGKCLKVCPVHSMYSLTEDLYACESAFAAYSKDSHIRKSSASGGFITSFLCFMIEKGYADGALVSKREGISGKSFLAKNRQEIISSQTSIYAPVDYTQGLKELLESSLKRVVIVGLPCQIRGVYNICSINRKLQSKILLYVSIICGKTPTTNAYKYISHKNGIDYSKISYVRNRGDGWPGYMTIKHIGGEYKTPYKSNMSMGMVLSSPLLCNPGCLSCMDGLGVIADIVVSDAWNPKYTRKKSDGWNYVLARTPKGYEYLQKEAISDYLCFEGETKENFFKANRRVIEKYRVATELREKQNSINVNYGNLKFKEKIYVLVVTFIKMNNYCKKNIIVNKLTLMLGKVVNKLK